MELFEWPNVREIAFKLFEVGAIMDKSRSPDGKGFRLKLHEKHPDAPLSPFYINLRTVDNPKPGPLTQDLVWDIGMVFYDVACARKISYDVVAGIPNAGDPFADAYVRTARSWCDFEPVIRLEKLETAQGRNIARVLDGQWKSGDIVLLLDDLITKADTKLEAIRACETAGLVVKDLIVLFDREQGGVQELQGLGYRVHALIPFSCALDLYVENNRMSEATAAEIREYLKANA